MVIKDFTEMREMVSSGKKKKVAVVCAHDEHALEAVLKANEEGLLDYILIGKKGEIIEKAKLFDVEVLEEDIVDCDDDKESAKIGVQLIKDGKADFIQKGIVHTAVLMREVVNPETGLNVGRPISHVAFLQPPGYHKIVAVTDGGVVIAPDLEMKKNIAQNAVDAFRAIGYERPKVAALCALEIVNPKMADTLDAKALSDMAEAGEIENCSLAGPISMDIACDKEAGKIKGYEHDVAGDADILLVPGITAGNVIVKALTSMADTLFAGCAVGAKCPIALNSRSSSFEEKYYGLIACSLIAGGRK